MTLEELLFAFCQKLKQDGNAYAFLRGWEDLPEKISGGDIDILVHDADSALAGLRSVFAEGVVITCLSRRHKSYNVFIYGLKAPNTTVQIDLFQALHHRGADYIDASACLKDASAPSDKPDWLLTLPELTQTTIQLLNQYLIGAVLPAKTWGLYVKTARENRIALRKMLESAFGFPLASALVNCLSEKEHLRALRLRPQLVRYFYLSRYRQWGQIVRYYLDEAKLAWSGKHVFTLAVLGPDGSGKTTLLFKLMKTLQGTAKILEMRHFLPQAVDPNDVKDATLPDPHAKPDRNLFASLAKLGLFCAKYWLARAIPQRLSKLIIYDRHAYDMLADPKRYRYSAPKWLTRLAIRYLFPQPDLLVILGGDAEVIHKRKEEVPLAETKLQLSRYEALRTLAPRAYSIDTRQSKAAVHQEALAAILREMQEKGAR